jgi:hypothetical protein
VFKYIHDIKGNIGTKKILNVQYLSLKMQTLYACSTIYSDKRKTNYEVNVLIGQF